MQPHGGSAVGFFKQSITGSAFSVLINGFRLESELDKFGKEMKNGTDSQYIERSQQGKRNPRA